MMESRGMQIEERGGIARNVGMTRRAVVGGNIAVLVMGEWLGNCKRGRTVTMRSILRLFRMYCQTLNESR